MNFELDLLENDYEFIKKHYIIIKIEHWKC